MVHYVYLHGFASSPNSTKARYFQQQFQALHIDLIVPDLNQDDFTHLTLTRQIQQVAALLPPDPVVLIGSSLGGLTAAWVAEHCPQVGKLVLLAPAFEFLAHWTARLGLAKLEQWQAKKTLEVYHYAQKTTLLLDHQFLVDAGYYSDPQLQRPIPTYILHGIDDEVIPIQASQTYAATRPWVSVNVLQSDHSLGNVLPMIWQELCRFCEIS